MAGKLMRAVQYSTYGGGVAGLQHVEIPIPVPKADEVLLKVEATSLNAADWIIQKGTCRPILPGKFPFVPGTDVAGEIVQVGSGASKFKVGDKVIASLHLVGGGLAEYAVAKASLTVARPEQVSAPEGAALPIAGLTAHQAITRSCGLNLNSNNEKKNILITAASGGVGHYAVQLAKLGNAHVTATCGARNIELVKGLGADEVIDYATPEGAALKSPSGKEYDFVVNLAAVVPWSTIDKNLSSCGKVVDLHPGLGFIWTFILKKLTFSKKQLVTFSMVPKAENLEFLVILAVEKKLKTVVDSRFPLSKTEDAWEKIMSGHATGKIIVEP